jgi:hypothetical protein
MLIQHRDPDYPLRVREYLRVGARYSPWLANKLREPHWGDVDVSAGFILLLCSGFLILSLSLLMPH